MFDIHDVGATDSGHLLSKLQIQATDEVSKCKNIRRISIAPLIGEAIKRISAEESVSSLFD